MFKRVLCGLLASFWLLAGAAAFAEPNVPPRPTSSIYVQDYAGVLDGSVEQKINETGARLKEKTKAQIVVVTVKTLDGAPIENYALEILRAWGVGDRQLNNGAVFLVAVDDRQSRVEVGYGLEGALPDGLTGRIQDEVMMPLFRQGDYNTGIYNAYSALCSVAASEGDTAAVQNASRTAETSWYDSLKELVIGVVVVAFIILDFIFFGGRFTFLILSLLRSRGGGGGGGYGGGSGGGGGSSRRW